MIVTKVYICGCKLSVWSIFQFIIHLSKIVKNYFIFSDKFVMFLYHKIKGKKE